MRIQVLCPTTDFFVGSETVEHLRSMTLLPFGANVSVDEEERGFTWNVNKLLVGVMETNATHIVIINDDIRVETFGWLEMMIDALEESPTYGLATPTGVCRTQPICFGDKDTQPGVQTVMQLPMFLTVIKREVIDVLGLFCDEFRHYGSDSDYVMRARKAGFQSIWVRHCFVVNKLSPIREEWKKHDREVFKRKYGW